MPTPQPPSSANALKSDLSSPHPVFVALPGEDYLTPRPFVINYGVGIMKISLFGNLRITNEGLSVAALNTNRLQSLLAYLILHGDEPQPRERVAFSLWPASSESQARTNLRQLIHHLKRALPAACDLLPGLYDDYRPPAFEHVGPMPFPMLQSVFDGLYPPGVQWY